MLVKEFVSKAMEMNEHEWALYFKMVWDNIYCPISHASMLQFQKNWYKSSDRPRVLAPELIKADFAKFRIAQKQEALKCLSMEMSEIGSKLREKFNLRPLSMDSSIDVGERVRRERPQVLAG